MDPVNNSFSFIPGFMSDITGAPLIMGVGDSDRIPHEELWVRRSPPRTLQGRVTVLDVDSDDEEIRKPSPPILPPFPVKPQKIDISTIREIPAELVDDELFVKYECPITLLPIRDPVVHRNHPTHVYERRAVNKWLFGINISPLSGEKMTSDDLVPHFTLKVQIDDKLRVWAEKQHEEALQQYGEVVRKHEEEVQEILAKHKLAMREYEAAKKEREEEVQSRQMPLGADLLRSKFSEVQKKEIIEQCIRNITEQTRRVPFVAGLEEMSESLLSTTAKVNSLAMGFFGADMAMMSQQLTDEDNDAMRVAGLAMAGATLGIMSGLARRSQNQGASLVSSELREPSLAASGKEREVRADLQKILSEIRESEERARRAH